MTDLPRRPLYEFCYIHRINERLEFLSNLAETENWDYQNTESDHPLPVLYNYFHNTFERVQEQGKIATTPDDEFCCFNTGLVTPHQEPLYALFSKNQNEGQEPWRFVKFWRKGEYELTKFATLPEIATYFDDPSVLVFDPRIELRINVEHFGENQDRFPEPFKSMDQHALQMIVRGAVENATERVRRNYKAAVPQFYKGRVQLCYCHCVYQTRQRLIWQSCWHRQKVSTAQPRALLSTWPTTMPVCLLGQTGIGSSRNHF